MTQRHAPPPADHQPPPGLEVRAAFAPSSVNAEARTVELTWTTGARVLRYDYETGSRYWEQLRVDAGAVDLARLNGGAPLLAQHNQRELAGQIGVVERAWIAGGVGHARVRFSKRADVEPLWQDVRDGILRNVSVGYAQNRVRELDEELDGIPVREVTRWTPHELSLVTIPADAGAHVRTAPTHTQERSAMANHYHSHGRMTGNDRAAQFHRDAVEGLAHRTGGPTPTTHEGRAFAAQSVLDLARRVLQMGGRNTSGMHPAELARAAMATSDFAHIIADFASRELARGYDAEIRTFPGVFRETSANNFQTIERMKLSDFPELQAVAEGAAYAEAAFSETRETYQVAKYGRRAGYTWEMAVNDDVNALSRLVAMMGAAAARLENDVVWNVLVNNAAMSDANPIFYAGGNNEVTDVLDAPGLEAARKYLRDQTAPNGSKLNLPAQFLVVGPELESTAEKLVAVLPELAASSRGDIVAPTLRSSLRLVVEPRITGTNWYVLTGTSTIDTVEYAYLLGERRPVVTREAAFDTDTMNLKIRHVIGAGAIERRGMYHSTGTGL